jgi:hypothetical protein
MVFIIAKIAGKVMPLFIDGWAVVDFENSTWHVPFHMTGFNDKIFKGMKKDELHNIGSRMNLKLDKYNDKGKRSSKTIAEMRSTIESGWSGYFREQHTAEVEVKPQTVIKSPAEVEVKPQTVINSPAPATVPLDFIDLLDMDKLIKQSLFINILFKKVLLKKTLLKHILK